MADISEEAILYLYKRIAAIQDFVERNKISHRYIRKQTGLPMSRINKILSIYDTDLIDLKINYDKYQKDIYALERFMERERFNHEITFGFHKLPADEFEELFNKVYEEVGWRNKQTLTEEAKKTLHNWYYSFTAMPTRLNSKGQVVPWEPDQSFRWYVFGNYPLDKQSDIMEAYYRMRDISGRKYGLQREIQTLSKEFQFQNSDQGSETNAEQLEQIKERIKKCRQELRHVNYILENGDPSIKCSREAIEAEKQHNYFIYFRYDFSERAKKNVSGMDYHKLSHERIRELTADQQKAFLSVLHKRCFGKRRHLMPEHFGTGIYLTEMNISSPHYSYNWVENKKKYKPGDTLPETSISDPIREYISGHSRVFLELKYCHFINDVRGILDMLSPEVAEQLILHIKKYADRYLHLKLEGNSFLKRLDSEKERNFYKTIAEYIDLFSDKEPFGKGRSYSSAQLYRLLYEICESSDGQYSFSIDAVLELKKKLLYTSEDWFLELQLYIYGTYWSYSTLKPILRELLQAQKDKGIDPPKGLEEYLEPEKETEMDFGYDLEL